MGTSFETTTCSRCGGSGKYSYNQYDGDRCFGCAGSGITFSKRGAKARTKFYESIQRHVSELQPGMKIRENGKWWTIKSIEHVGLNSPDEVRVNIQCYGILISASSTLTGGTIEEINAKLDEAIVYQNTLKK